MACRDCKWWSEVEPAGRYEAVGDCNWPIPSLPHSIDETSYMMQESQGKGCPQFKERTDGKADPR